MLDEEGAILDDELAGRVPIAAVAVGRVDVEGVEVLLEYERRDEERARVAFARVLDQHAIGFHLEQVEVDLRVALVEARLALDDHRVVVLLVVAVVGRIGRAAQAHRQTAVDDRAEAVGCRAADLAEVVHAVRRPLDAARHAIGAHHIVVVVVVRVVVRVVVVASGTHGVERPLEVEIGRIGVAHATLELDRLIDARVVGPLMIARALGRILYVMSLSKTIENLHFFLHFLILSKITYKVR